MNRLFLWGFVCLLVGGVWVDSAESTAWNASPVTITILNMSEKQLCQLYISPSAASNWNNEQLNGGRMSHWAKRNFSITPGTYDLRANDCNGNLVDSLYKVNLNKGQTIRLDVDGWKATTVQTQAPQQNDQQAAANAWPQDSDWDRVPDNIDQCKHEKETYNNVFDEDGCPDHIDDLLNFGIRDIDSYWRQVFNNSDLAYRTPQQVNLTWRSDYLAFYNSRQHTIDMSRVFATQAVNEIGDYAPVVALAHEWGHLVQSNLGLLDAYYYTISLELQADCFAGAYTKNIEARGLLDEEDVYEGATLMYAVGDNKPWFHPDAHGSSEERVGAFTRGYNQGPNSCFNYTNY